MLAAGSAQDAMDNVKLHNLGGGGQDDDDNHHNGFKIHDGSMDSNYGQTDFKIV